MEETTSNEANPICLAGSDQQSSVSINLTGSWFVNFGLDIDQGKIEGCRIITLKGNFNPDTLIDTLVDAIYRDLPDNAREFIDRSGKMLIIRAFNRI